MHRLVGTPFEYIGKYVILLSLALFGAGSRIMLDYFKQNKVPPKRVAFAIIVLSIFSTVLTYLIMDYLNYSDELMRIVVVAMGFIGHTALTWLLENWTKYIPGHKTGKDIEE